MGCCNSTVLLYVGYTVECDVGYTMECEFDCGNPCHAPLFILKNIHEYIAFFASVSSSSLVSSSPTQHAPTRHVNTVA